MRCNNLTLISKNEKDCYYFDNSVFFHYMVKKNSPNFIFILADDQGWNGTSVKMMEKSPYPKVTITKHQI